MTQLEKFDYAALDQETRIVVQQRAEEIRGIGRRMTADLIEMGAKLCQIRDLLRHDKHGGFEGWLRVENFERKFAYNCMLAYVQFGNRVEIAQLNIGMSALFLLAAPSTPDEIREYFAQKAEAGEEVKHKDVKVAIEAAPKRFKQYDEVYHEDRRYTIATILDDHATLSARNGLKKYNVPLIELQTPAEHREAELARHKAAATVHSFEREPTVDPAARADQADRPAAFDPVVNALMRAYQYAVDDRLNHGGHSYVYGNYQSRELVSALVADGLIEAEYYQKPGELLRITRAGCERLGQPLPEWMAESNPAQLHAGDLVLNPIGEVFEVVELEGETSAWCVDADGEKFELTVSALTVIDLGANPTPLTAEQIADVKRLASRALREWKEGESPAGAAPAADPLTTQDALKQQLRDAGLDCFRIVAHNKNGLAGTFSAGIFTEEVGDAAWAEAHASAEAIRALGFQVLHAGIDAGPGYAVMGFNGQPAIFVHFADAEYQKPAAVPEAPAAPIVQEAAGAARTKFADADSDPTNDEWYTPADVMGWVRAVLEVIDLDPASCAAAQETVQATAYIDKKHDGLKADWHGRIFLNPPYSYPLVEQFALKLISEYQADHVTEALVLVNNRTDAGWFHALLRSASAACFLIGRINFLRPGQDLPGNRQGQVIFYFGSNLTAFSAEFAARGTLVQAAPIYEAQS